MISDCLIEIGTEELPPKALKSLSAGLSQILGKLLEDAGLKSAASEQFATPRRLAVLFRDIPLRQPDQLIERKGPALQAAFDQQGQPSKAALGFARSCGVDVSELEQRETDKGCWLYFEKNQPGLSLKQILPDLLQQALQRLPIAKRMRWGSGTEEFVRPVKWLVMMIGEELVEGSAFGVESSTASYGHRFHAPGKVAISSAGEYQQSLLSQGFVMASSEQREDTIRTLVEDNARRLGGIAHIEDELLEEVSALVEYPTAVSGEFDEEFLQVPQEALVMTMQDNQKYFAVFDAQNNLLPYFITISNIDSKNPEVVARGNERVIRPRFADARFFFEQDRRQPLAALSGRLDSVVFQQQLGSIGDKARRISTLAEFIAQKTGANTELVKRAALLCKCDLLTDMVGEFPKLQGVMGRYYAQHDGEDNRVSTAIEQHYWPRFAGDDLPEDDIAQCLAIADRLDSLVGIFSIGQKPSGDKDPFALRRAALGVVRLLIERDMAIDLRELCQCSVSNLPDSISAENIVDEVIDYVFDRLTAYYQEQKIGVDIVDAVLATRPMVLSDCDRRIRAVASFQNHESAAALAAANKRIQNILKKQDRRELSSVSVALFCEKAEAELHKQLESVSGQARAMFGEGRYLDGLEQLAELRPAVDQFFDDVMVMVDDDKIKNNRLALLEQLMATFRQVADFSRIQP
ncbi:MAG: glycine--tRNA ligase subunit beta [Gammaproteobacteria bacterium]|nr:glycine--tRNA ligase subunit beta [Gammaproteobacteria bacterium]